MDACRLPLPRVFSVLIVVLAVGYAAGCKDSTAPNQVPTAVVGPDMVVNVGQLVQMSGAGSTDPDGDPVTYSWTFITRPVGSNASISSPTSMSPTFTADVRGAYVAQLIVSDGEANSTPAHCTITANAPPVANAGPDQTVEQGSVVQLDGSGSTDPDGNPLTYVWSFLSRPQGSQAALSQTNVANPSFTADVDGDFALQLVVNDGNASSAPDQVTITSVGGPTPGTYSGTTSQGKLVTFVVSSSRTSVQTGMKIAFRLSCSFCSGTSTITLNRTLTLADGKFSYSSGTPGMQGHLAFEGEATSTTTFSGTGVYSPRPPLGCGTCSTQNITWQATWVGPAPNLDSAARQVDPPAQDVERIITGDLCVDTKIKVRKEGKT